MTFIPKNKCSIVCAFFAVCILILAACGGSATPTKPPTPTPTPNVSQKITQVEPTQYEMAYKTVPDAPFQVSADIRIPRTICLHRDKDSVGAWVGLSSQDWLVQIIVSQDMCGKWRLFYEVFPSSQAEKRSAAEWDLETPLMPGNAVSLAVKYDKKAESYEVSATIGDVTYGPETVSLKGKKGQHSPSHALWAVEATVPMMLTKFTDDIVFSNLMVNNYPLNTLPEVQHSSYYKTSDTYDIKKNTIAVRWKSE
jgi:hypothetical protein